MLAIFNAQAQSQRSWAVALALLLVYIVWGTTYFAIGIAVQTMPPLLMNAIRFLCAGGVMLLIALWQGHALPTWVQWRNSAVVGGCMVFLAMNLMGFAQKLGIGSGLMATVVTTMPMWLALWTRWGGEHVPATSWVGLALGVVGALLLALEGDFSASGLGALLAFGAPLCWSIGSYAYISTHRVQYQRKTCSRCFILAGNIRSKRRVCIGPEIQSMVGTPVNSKCSIGICCT